MQYMDCNWGLPWHVPMGIRWSLFTVIGQDSELIKVNYQSTNQPTYQPSCLLTNYQSTNQPSKRCAALHRDNFLP